MRCSFRTIGNARPRRLSTCLSRRWRCARPCREDILLIESQARESSQHMVYTFSGLCDWQQYLGCTEDTRQRWHWAGTSRVDIPYILPRFAWLSTDPARTQRTSRPPCGGVVLRYMTNRTRCRSLRYGPLCSQGRQWPLGPAHMYSRSTPRTFPGLCDRLLCLGCTEDTRQRWCWAGASRADIPCNPPRSA